MALSIFNPTTHENRLLTEAETAALYASDSVPPAGDEASPQSPRPTLGEGEVLIDWETHLYDFTSGQVVPIHVPLSQQFAELRQTLGGEIARLESRIAMLEAAFAQQAEKETPEGDQEPEAAEAVA